MTRQKRPQQGATVLQSARSGKSIEAEPNTPSNVLKSSRLIKESSTNDMRCSLPLQRFIEMRPYHLTCQDYSINNNPRKAPPTPTPTPTMVKILQGSNRKAQEQMKLQQVHMGCLQSKLFAHMIPNPSRQVVGTEDRPCKVPIS
jgi:hypothetical protein